MGDMSGSPRPWDDGVVTSDELADLLVTAPAGVALLQYLEHAHRLERSPLSQLVDCDPDAVTSAVAAVSAMTAGELMGSAIEAADQIAGPWNSRSMTSLPTAYRFAPQRAKIADEIARVFTTTLSNDFDRSGQQWWNTTTANSREPAHVLGLPTHVSGSYCCGEWPWRRAWTITTPPPEIHESLAVAWEMYSGQISRWHLGVSTAARVLEIHRPDDWRQLVADYPLVVSGRHEGWELPGINQQRQRSEVAGVASASSGHAARLDVEVAMPDWRLVAQDWDAVHLSWAGMLTCEGHVIDVPELGPGVVTMLRFWFTERTLWFRSSAFEEPTGLPPATMTGNLQSTPVSTLNRPAPQFANWPI